jgi:hypothetical protein
MPLTAPAKVKRILTGIIVMIAFSLFLVIAFSGLSFD